MNRIARRSVRGLDQIAAQEIVLKVEIEIMQLVLSEEPSRKADYLEVAFAQAVERRTVDMVRSHMRSPMGGRRGELAGAIDEDGDEIERPIELAPDHRPGPEATFLQKEDEDSRPELILKGLNAITNPLHRKVVILHCLCGFPIASKDSEKFDLVRCFQARPAQIKYWRDAGLKEMREALTIGEKK
jgi:hypothetical protein